jgi:hypothetical protein
MTLPSNFYRDPAELLEELERRTCRGCIHLTRVLDRDFCSSPKRRNGKAEMRCKYYKTNEED